MNRRIYSGWAWAKCLDCGIEWKETRRDIHTPTPVDCPNHCDHGGDTEIWKVLECNDLPKDEVGNLLKHEIVILSNPSSTEEESPHPYYFETKEYYLKSKQC